MMITIDQKTFERVVSSATNADNQVFDKIEPHFAWTEEQLNCELLGPIADKLETIPNLTAVVMRLICLRTYMEQIPHLDLVLTATGFGIVSNNNLAPASADRVKNLLQQVKNAYEDSYDKAIEMLIGNEEWADAAQGRINVVNMIYTAKGLRLYTDKPNAHRSDLAECHVAIYKAEEKVREHISSEFFDSLLVKIRKYNLSRMDSYIIDLICKFIGFCIARDWTPAKSMLVKIEDFAEKNAETFIEYKNSNAYKVKHFEPYKNDQESSAYFFG